MKLSLLPYLGLAGMLSACSGINAVRSTPNAAAAPQSIQQVAGTLQIAVPPRTRASSVLRDANGRQLHPDYVSAGTTHAALFIDGAASPAGQTTSCSATTGTGAGCTISWSATLGVPGTHNFAVEIDGSTAIASGNYVLAEGEGAYHVIAGSGNSLGNGTTGGAPLSLNGVAAIFFYVPSTIQCAATCSLQFYFTDAAEYAIGYSGSTAVPTEGNPTSGNVFDNDGGGSSDLTLTSDAPTIGYVNGNAESSGTNTFATFGLGKLTIVGVPPLPISGAGQYTVDVACQPSVTGSFGVKISGGTTPSGDVTSTELSGLSPAVSYALALATPDADTGPLFNCNNGSISGPSGSSSGALVVN